MGGMQTWSNAIEVWLVFVVGCRNASHVGPVRPWQRTQSLLFFLYTHV